MPTVAKLDTSGEVVVILSVCQLLGLTRVQTFAIITVQKDFNISEHGEKPWRTQRCGRGLKSAKTPNERGHCRGLPRWEGCRQREEPRARRPVEAEYSLSESDGKGLRLILKDVSEPFLFGLVDT